MGVQPILPIKVSITIGIILNFDGDCDGHGVGTCKHSLTKHGNSRRRISQFNLKCWFPRNKFTEEKVIIKAQRNSRMICTMSAEKKYPTQTQHWPPLGSVYKAIINWSTIITVRVYLKNAISLTFLRGVVIVNIIECSTKCLLFFSILVLSNNYLTSPVKL